MMDVFFMNVFVRRSYSKRTKLLSLQMFRTRKNVRAEPKPGWNFCGCPIEDRGANIRSSRKNSKRYPSEVGEDVSRVVTTFSSRSVLDCANNTFDRLNETMMKQIAFTACLLFFRNLDVDVIKFTPPHEHLFAILMSYFCLQNSSRTCLTSTHCNIGTYLRMQSNISYLTYVCCRLSFPT